MPRQILHESIKFQTTNHEETRILFTEEPSGYSGLSQYSVSYNTSVDGSPAVEHIRKDHDSAAEALIDVRARLIHLKCLAWRN